MSTYRCASCGREIAAAPRCPHCHAEQGQWAEELIRIERSIADLKARDAAIAKEQSAIASKMAAALFQRDILAHANQERLKQATKPGWVLRRKMGRRSPAAEPDAPPRIPRQPPFSGTADPPPPENQPPVPAPGHSEPHPETSSREVQNVLLGLGALLLGVAAVVFAAVADDVTRVAILAAATALMLGTPPLVARRGLTSTAETIAAVGLLLVALDGYALWTVDPVRAGPLSGAVFASLTFVATAAVAEGYARATGFRAPRYAAILAAQPVLPLLADDWITGPAGWALVLSAVAALDLHVGRQMARYGRLIPPQRLGAGARIGRPPDTATANRSTGPVDRPETAAEEADAAVVPDTPGSDPRAPNGREGTPDDRPDTPYQPRLDAREGTDGSRRPADAPRQSGLWLVEVTWTLHGLAVLAALVYAIVALLAADTVPTASRAGSALLLAAVVGLAGARTVRQPPLPDLAAGVLTLGIIAALGRVAAVALPGDALLLIALVIALTGAAVRVMPPSARRGPQLASAVALVVIGVIVAGSSLRAALAPIRAALPAWDADLITYDDQLATAVGSADWQLATTAFLLTIAAVLSLPHEFRREFAVAAAALAALAVPASFGLAWSAAPWPAVLAAIGIGVTGLSAPTERAARAHVIAAAVVGFAGAGASVARPGLTAAVLFTLTAAGALIALATAFEPIRTDRAADIVAAWSSGGAAFALPGAVAATAVTVVPISPAPTPAALQAATAPVLAACFLAACATLSYASIALVARRQISLPLTVGTGLGAVAVTMAAFGAAGATVADAWVGTLLMVAAVLLFLAPSIDVGRRADRLLDGPDFAAAAATAVLIGTLARIATILAPGAELAASAGLVLAVAVGVRSMYAEWRRGPILGVAVGGGVIALIAGTTALRDGLRALSTSERLWDADLAGWPVNSAAGGAWQVPLALVLLAVAAAVALPRPWAYDVAAVFVGLATVGTPAALGLPWWSPIVVGCAVATGYGLASVVAADPRAGLARATVAVAVALHAIGTSLVRPGTTAAALGMVTLIGVAVATLARVTAAPPDERDPDVDPMPPHLALIGGAATCGALLALPGAVAALLAGLGRPTETMLAAALGASSLGLAVVALARAHVPHYLPYATVGVAGGATVTAIAALPTDLPAGVYAAATVLLGVLAERLRAATPPPGATEPVRRWSATLRGAPRWLAVRPSGGGWSVSPEMGALTIAVLPTALTLAALGPALQATLIAPHRTLYHIWDGPPAAFTTSAAGADNATNVAAALLLTIAAALAATGFNGRRPAHAVPVILPGAAITLLITPISLGLGWPTSTLAALGVFTLSMLGLALTPPPRETVRNRPVRVARVIVFGIGLAAGGAGLAGSLASPELTLLTLGGAVCVGAVAGLAGRTQHARILGWLFASTLAHGFVLTAGLRFGIEPRWSAFGALAVGAALLLLAASLPRLRRAEAMRETATVEWSGYAAALIALALAYDSARHIATLLAAWGAVLGVAALRPGQRAGRWRVLFWTSVGCEITAWWMMMYLAEVALPEAYTLPFAALALLIGLLELRQRPELSSWVAYAPALVATLLPTMVIVIATDAGHLREILLLLGAVGTLIFGSLRRQQAPVVIGAMATAITALHALTLVGPWLVLIPVGLTLLVLGASNERRRRTQERLKAVREMR